jgi:hypothetical protein
MRTLTRQQAIDELRGLLVRLTDDENSICAVATRLEIFCKGFRRMSDHELEARCDWLVARQKPKDREALEDLANRWQLARQAATGLPLACDVQALESDICSGWEDFDNRALERFYLKLAAESVRIV